VTILAHSEKSFFTAKNPTPEGQVQSVKYKTASPKRERSYIVEIELFVSWYFGSKKNLQSKIKAYY